MAASARLAVAGRSALRTRSGRQPGCARQARVAEVCTTGAASDAFRGEQKAKGSLPGGRQVRHHALAPGQVDWVGARG